MLCAICYRHFRIGAENIGGLMYQNEELRCRTWREYRHAKWRKPLEMVFVIRHSIRAMLMAGIDAIVIT